MGKLKNSFPTFYDSLTNEDLDIITSFENFSLALPKFNGLVDEDVEISKLYGSGEDFSLPIHSLVVDGGIFVWFRRIDA